MLLALPSYPQDTTHFLQTMEEWKQKFEPLPPGSLFVTIDVVGLYSNIPHSEAVTSLKEVVTSSPQQHETRPTTSVLSNIVLHILQNNVLQFEEQFYLQTLGTAMGTPMAPSIANIFMGWLERRLLSTSPWQIRTDVWCRYIDDIALLWWEGEENLRAFLNWLNEQHPTIKFTASYGTANIPFLDVKVSITPEGHISTDLHVKETDTGMTLPFNSCHPRHCVRSIPFSQCLRIRRICSSDSTFHQRSQELCDKLLKRGYPKALLKAAVTRVTSIPRQETLCYRRKEHTTPARTPYVVTHNPSNPPLDRWLKDNMKVLHSSRRMKEAVPLPPIVGERKCRNLRGLLMPSKAPPLQQPKDSSPAGCFKCAARKCIICQNHLVSTTSFTSARTQQHFTIRCHLTCQSSNIIYLIDCRQCKNIQYVGETGKTLQNRFYHHRSDIKTRKSTLVAQHFNSKNHTLADLACTAIEQIRQPDPQIRKQKEKYWRHKLKTNYPEGLNVWD